MVKWLDAWMIFKTIFMLSLYFIPYAIILSETVSIGAMWLCSFFMGLGLAGIGMSVMHDANHGGYSSSNTINKIVGTTLNIVGGDSNNWKIQHNILHHTYTNIHQQDEDVKNKAGMRFSPQGEYQPIHRYQVWYAFFLYSLMTLFWCTLKDFPQFFRYIRKGHIQDNKRERFQIFFNLVIWKLIYWFYSFAIPIIVLDIAWWQVLIGFGTVHLVAGIVLSVVFQLAHVVEDTAFPVPDTGGNIENEWAIHQMHTTADFAANNPIVTFYVGGLNFQTEHHLFTRMCHVHYPKIAPIVKQTAEEFGIPYIYYPTMLEALASHLRFLKKLGRKEITHLAAEMG